MRLFKYYGSSDWVKTNLKDNYLYYANILNVNDPYECMIDFKFSEEWIKGQHKLLDEGILEEPYFEIENIEHSDAMTGWIKGMGDNLGNKLSIMLRHVFLDMFGLTCFSERKDSILMWGHYSESFRGVCIEYDIPENLKNRLVKVKYDDIPLTVNSDLPSVFEGKHGINDAIDIFSVKHSDWAYEKEWRLIGGKTGIEDLPMGSIKAVYFGVKSDREYRKMIIDSVTSKNKPVFYNMIPTNNSYSVEFEIVDETKARNAIEQIDINEIYDALLDNEDNT